MINWITIEREDGTFDIIPDPDGENYMYGDAGLTWHRSIPEVPKCECGMESTWQANHRRSCPSDKHSDWCKLYVAR